jgi:transposase
MHAFEAFGGVAREVAYDNLATAVAEHDGRLVRFHPRFLGFAREYGFCPRACNPASGWEKDQASHCTSLRLCSTSSCVARYERL